MTAQVFSNSSIPTFYVSQGLSANGSGGVNGNLVDLTVKSSLTLPSLVGFPVVITNSAVDTSVLQNYSGALVQVGAGTLRYQRVGDWVNLSFTQVSAPALVAAADNILLSTALPAPYRPPVDISVACVLNDNGAFVLGSADIFSATGLIRFGPAGLGTFTIGHTVALYGSFCATYPATP